MPRFATVRLRSLWFCYSETVGGVKAAKLDKLGLSHLLHGSRVELLATAAEAATEMRLLAHSMTV